MTIGFDVISDLYLRPGESINWEGKASSLYCIIAGNISHDLKIIKQTLTHLGQYYQGVFYCLGSNEYENTSDIDVRTHELIRLCAPIGNAVLLHQHVVIIDGVAILGVNGWYGNTAPSESFVVEATIEQHRHEDISYLKSSIHRLQKHLDVNKILVVSNSVPGPELYFGQEPIHALGQIPVNIALEDDTEKKVSHWVYGTYDKTVDITINNIKYVNNGCYKKSPYWPKHIEV